MFLHRFEHIPISDGSDHDMAADPTYRLMQADIAHDGSHQGVFAERLVPDQFMRQNHHDLIAVHRLPFFIHSQTPVRIAVKSES